ncbi:hypothetical protein BJ165DRAFT_1398524 [Panaeolus papilionaceus]|nr:hypothetical protein BJ165DRAFT_1398524 [Panaeolus papilionaceus]
MERNVTAGLLPVHAFTSSIENPRRLTIAKPRWHPKATPFRLLTTLSFAGLAILKAILIYRGSQIAPVAVEWICGTLLFIVCYVLDIFEQDGRLNDDTYRWFYDYDAMEFVWTFLARFQIDRPDYSTTELPNMNISLSRPLVTNYRLLVSATVLIFGVLKAVFAYGTGMLLFVIPAIYLFTIMLRFSKETFISILRGHPEKLDLTTVDGSGQFVAAMTNLIGTALLGYASLLPLLFAGFLLFYRYKKLKIEVHTPHHPTYHLDPGVVSLRFPVAGSICPITLGGLSHGRRFSVRVSHLLGGFGACHYLNVSPFVSPPKNREVERGSEESRVLLLKL